MIDADGHLVAHTATRRGQRRFGPKAHPNAQYIAEMPGLLEKLAELVEAMET